MRRLSTLLETNLSSRYPRESARLQKVLSEATVLSDERLPEGVVSMGARVFCEDDEEGELRKLTLSYPWDEDLFEGRVSILSPLGIALLGLQRGQTAEWLGEDGISRSLRVFDVTELPSNGLAA